MSDTIQVSSLRELYEAIRAALGAAAPAEIAVVDPTTRETLAVYPE